MINNKDAIDMVQDIADESTMTAVKLLKEQHAKGQIETAQYIQLLEEKLELIVNRSINTMAQFEAM